MPYDPARFLPHLRSALLSRVGPARLGALGLPWLVALVVLLGGNTPQPGTPHPSGQVQRSELPALERSAAQTQRLREGQPPQPWPDLPPHRAEWLAGPRALPVSAAQPFQQPAPQRLAHWGKWQLEGG